MSQATMQVRPPLRTITGHDLGPQLNVFRRGAERRTDAPLDLRPWYANQPWRAWWSSTLLTGEGGDGPSSDWTDYCREREPRWLADRWRLQTPDPAAVLLEITRLDDLTAILDAFPETGVDEHRHPCRVMDFAAIAEAGYAGVHLAAAAIWDVALPGRYGAWSGATSRARYGRDADLPCCALSSWEVESTCWVRPEALTMVRHLEPPAWWWRMTTRDIAAKSNAAMASLGAVTASSPDTGQVTAEPARRRRSRRRAAGVPVIAPIPEGEMQERTTRAMAAIASMIAGDE